MTQELLAQTLSRILKSLATIENEVESLQEELGETGVAPSEESDAASESLRTAKRAVLQSTKTLHEELAFYVEGLQWERVHIAFYGETNAGKSAIIAALTKSDGIRVGDGTKDYTDRVRKIPLGSVTLLDTPGIEGREGELLREVERALAVAHVVFVVLNGKEPEEGMLRKLKHHTRRSSYVISVLNQRGYATSYRGCATLLDPDTERQIVRIRTKFAVIFGDGYRGHVTLNALLALVSHGGSLQERFRPEQQKAAEIFGTLQKAQIFSRLPETKEVIEDTARAAKEIILQTNLFRTTKALDDVSKHLRQASRALHRGSELWNGVAAETHPRIELLLQQSRRTAELRISSDLQELAVTLKTLLRDGIEKDSPWIAIHLELQKAVRSTGARLQEKLREEQALLESELHRNFDRLQARLQLRIELDDDMAELGELLKDMAKGGGELLDVLVSAASSAFTGVLNPILGLVSAGLTALRKLWDWKGGGRDRRLREKKAKGNAAVDASVSKLRKRQFNELDKRWRRFTEQFTVQFQRVEAMGNGLQAAALSFKRRAEIIDAQRVKLDSLSLPVIRVGKGGAHNEPTLTVP